MSIDQIGEATVGEFHALFDREPAVNAILEKRYRRQRILWVIQHATMIELPYDSELFLSRISTASISSFLMGLASLPGHDESKERRRSSDSILVTLRQTRTPEAPQNLSQTILNVQKLVTRHSIVIEWVDNPSFHLAMPSDNTLQLFWHVSWCKSHILGSKKNKWSICTALGFPVTYIDEIIKTYGLLFNKYSLASTQAYYQSTRDPESQPMKHGCQDIWTDIFCGMKASSKNGEQGVLIDYSRFQKAQGTRGMGRKWTTADFPHFRERFEVLQEVVESSKTRRSDELWSYEPGSLAWFAF